MNKYAAGNIDPETRAAMFKGGYVFKRGHNGTMIEQYVPYVVEEHLLHFDHEAYRRDQAVP